MAYSHEHAAARRETKNVLLADTLLTMLIAQDGAPFTAKGMAKLVGEDKERVRKMLDLYERAGCLKSRVKTPSDPNALPYVLYTPIKKKLRELEQERLREQRERDAQRPHPAPQPANPRGTAKGGR